MGWFTNFIPTPAGKTYESPTRIIDKVIPWGRTWFSSKEENFVTKLRDALTTLRKNANLISNSLAGEAHIKVNYAQTGECNDFNGDEFKISPTLLLENPKARGDSIKVKEDDEYYDAIDALTGQILVGCQIRKNSNEKALNQFRRSKDEAARHFYKTLEEGRAFNQIANDWVGFTPYLESHRKEFHSSKDKVERLLAQPSPYSVAAALCWNLLHPHDKIDLGDFSTLETEFNDHMSKYDSVKPENRFQHAQEAFELIKKLFPACPSGGGPSGKKSEDGDGPPSSGGDSDDDKEDNKGGKEKSKGKGKGKSGKGKPEPNKGELEDLMDNTLFGDEIEGASGVGNKQVDNINNTTEDGLNHKNMDEKVHIEPLYRLQTPKGNRYKDAYKDIVRLHRGVIKGVEKSFLFRNTDKKIENYGLTVGDLDEHSLIKIPMGDLEHLYSRRDVLSQKDIAIGLLLDQSGSMGYPGKMSAARECVIVLREALRNIAGVQLTIYGYSAQHDGRNDVQMIRYMDKDSDQSEALAGADALRENMDGFSIRYISERLLEHQANARILFIICDGMPHAGGYGGEPAFKHTNACVEEARRKGIQVFAIGITNAFTPSRGRQLYGENGFVVIKDVESSMGILTREIKKFLNQQVMTTNC